MYPAVLYDDVFGTILGISRILGRESDEIYANKRVLPLLFARSAFAPFQLHQFHVDDDTRYLRFMVTSVALSA